MGIRPLTLRNREPLPPHARPNGRSGILPINCPGKSRQSQVTSSRRSTLIAIDAVAIASLILLAMLGKTRQFHLRHKLHQKAMVTEGRTAVMVRHVQTRIALCVCTPCSVVLRGRFLHGLLLAADVIFIWSVSLSCSATGRGNVLHAGLTCRTCVLMKRFRKCAEGKALIPTVSGRQGSGQVLQPTVPQLPPPIVCRIVATTRASLTPGRSSIFRRIRCDGLPPGIATRHGGSPSGRV